MAPALLVLSSMLYVGFAGTPALVDDDIDAAHALVAREMLQRHDYVVMYQNGIRYMIRPPMHFWLIAGSYALLGETEFATRLPVALAMVGLVLLTFTFGRRFFGERAGFYAALAVATGAGMFIFTRTVIPEAIYALEFTAFFYLFLRSWTGSLDPRLGYRAAAAVGALAALTRGVIGVLFPVGAVLVFITWTKGWSRWRELRIPSGIAIVLAIAAPWHVLAERRAPGFLWVYFVSENVLRALGRREPHDYSTVPLWLWWLEHLAWLFPWSFFAPLLVREFPGRRFASSGDDAGREARRLLYCWAGFILAFFTIEGGSRMEYYSFGAWPAIALLLGAGIADAEADGDPWLRRGAAALAAVGAAFAAAAIAFLAWFGGGGGSADIGKDLQARGADFYQNSMAHILDLTPRALADLRAPLILSAFSLGVAFLTAWILRRRGRDLASTATTALGMAGFFVSANLAYRDFEPSLSSRTLALELNQSLRPEDRVALFGDIRVAPGVAFYCRRRVLLYDAGGSNLEFGSRYPDAPRTFYDDREFLPLWTGTDRVILIVPADRNDEALRKLPAGSARVLASAGGKIAYTNRSD